MRLLLIQPVLTLPPEMLNIDKKQTSLIEKKKKKSNRTFYYFRQLEIMLSYQYNIVSLVKISFSFKCAPKLWVICFTVVMRYDYQKH